MELRQLRYFVAVAEELHFGRAAERLHVAQPAVSQQLARLERQLGVTLLDRNPRSVRLTEDGERMLVEARAVLAAAEQAAAVAAQLKAGTIHTLRFGTSPGLGPRIEKGIEALRAADPELVVELDARSVAQQLAAIRSGDLDAALVRAIAPRHGVETFELWHDQVAVALPASSPLAQQDTIRLEQLADLPLRLPAEECDSLFRAAILDACRKAGFEPRLGRKATTIEDTLVEVGTGAMSWAATFSCSQAVEDGKASVRLVDPPLMLPGGVVVPETLPTACARELAAAFG
ncbi:LysR family transcriptional regulator [Tenggerimyces flavus]|uniref:LysR family transcriptional regulator n=1 Tax=Tenggerimyces flavus TaxID=1708749 RepID=A0ABV7YE70_9ACTN|nr:LysR family transcriptional regulator [Tenggerimyces flavus]MBM7786956.1 DNA-binding transcriptional LysR family regulator [Tenggerimyces flavus]